MLLPIALAMFFVAAVLFFYNIAPVGDTVAARGLVVYRDKSQLPIYFKLPYPLLDLLVAGDALHQVAELSRSDDGAAAAGGDRGGGDGRSSAGDEDPVGDLRAAHHVAGVRDVPESGAVRHCGVRRVHHSRSARERHAQEAREGAGARAAGIGRRAVAVGGSGPRIPDGDPASGRARLGRGRCATSWRRFSTTSASGRADRTR